MKKVAIIKENVKTVLDNDAGKKMVIVKFIPSRYSMTNCLET